MMTNYLKPKEGPKAYAKNQVNEIWSIGKFAKHIADHNGVYSRGTVKGVLSDMCECLVEQLLNGNKIQLGELGTFGISISSEPTDSLDKFSAKNIKAVNILFTPGEDFENLVSHAQFNLVPSRAAQNATLKAEKSNEKTVDLEAAKKKNNTSSGGCGIVGGLDRDFLLGDGALAGRQNGRVLHFLFFHFLRQFHVRRDVAVVGVA